MAPVMLHIDRNWHFCDMRSYIGNVRKCLRSGHHGASDGNNDF